MSNNRYPVVFWAGTQAEYNALTTKSNNTIYFLLDINAMYRGSQRFGGDVTVAEARQIASAVVASGGFISSGGALVTQVGDYRLSLTSGGFIVSGSGAEVALSGGKIAAKNTYSYNTGGTLVDATVVFDKDMLVFNVDDPDMGSAYFEIGTQDAKIKINGNELGIDGTNVSINNVPVATTSDLQGAIMSGAEIYTTIGGTRITATSGGVVTVSGGGASMKISGGCLLASGSGASMLMSGGGVSVSGGKAFFKLSPDNDGVISAGNSKTTVQLGGANPEDVYISGTGGDLIASGFGGARVCAENIIVSGATIVAKSGMHSATLSGDGLSINTVAKDISLSAGVGASVNIHGDQLNLISDDGHASINSETLATENFVTSATSGITKSTDTMPTAAATLLNKVYLYTGDTTSSYKHGHLYVCRSSGGAYSWVDVQTGLHGVGNLSGIRCFVIGGNATIKWSDPDDLVVDGVTLATWGKTVLVRKSDGYPTSVTDGTVLLTNTTRNAYKTNGFTEAVPAGETYYYRWFIYTDDGVLNDDPANEAVTGVLTWASILDMCGDSSIDMRDVFSPGDVLTAANSVRATDGNGNFQWQVTDVTEHDFGLCAYKSFAQIQFDAPQKAYALTPDTVFDTSKLLNFSGYNTTNGDYFLKDETATGNDRVWRRRSGTMEVRYYNGGWIVFNTTNSTTAATQTTAATDPWDGAWSNSIVVAKAKKYYTYDGASYAEATVTDGAAVTADTYYEANPGGANRISYGSNDYENSPYDQLLNSDGDAGTFLVLPTIWSNLPAWAAQQAGFMKGFDPDFLAAVKDTTFTVNLNTVCAGGGQKTLTRKFYLLSQAEVGLGGSEGSVLDLYNGAENADRIKYNLSGGAQHWFLRSPVVGNSHNVYVVHSSGALNSNTANVAFGCVPACRIGVNQA